MPRLALRLPIPDVEALTRETAEVAAADSRTNGAYIDDLMARLDKLREMQGTREYTDLVLVCCKRMITEVIMFLLKPDEETTVNRKPAREQVDKWVELFHQLLGSKIGDELAIFSREVIRFGGLCKHPVWYNLGCYFDKLMVDFTPQDHSKERMETTVQRLINLAQNVRSANEKLEVMVGNTAIVANFRTWLSSLLPFEHCPLVAKSFLSIWIYADGLVKKAYEDWMHVVEHDGKALLSFKQKKKSVTTRSGTATASTSSPAPYGSANAQKQWSLSAKAEQTSMGATNEDGAINGYSGNQAARYMANPHNIPANITMQYGRSSLSSESQFNGSSLLAQASTTIAAEF